ncbi:MAG: serine hydrolase domain-containing protein [Candidatus Methylacidiphilales bacterium]|nr:serine hydrolase domain-containing protein [Candidatus Methylacidiphilales bacterium]
MNNINQKIQSLLNQIVEEDAERGLQVAAYHRGELIVDAAAGTMDAATGRPVTSSTLFPVFSTTKGFAATLTHILVERGKVAYETRLADVWPEFAAHGKGKVTLQHALNHTAGVPLMPLATTHRDLASWDKMCALIADLTPVSPAGMQHQYHAITYSWTVGEVLRRVDGRSFQQMLHEEINVPLGTSREIYVGISDDAEPRVATLEAGPADPSAPPPDFTTPQAIPPLVLPLHDWMNRADARRACIPASTGIMSARAIARHYASLLPGGVDGVELLSPERVRIATEQQYPGNYKPEDPLPPHRLGYGAGSGFAPTTFGHGGAGGSSGFADPVSGIAFAFTRNRFVSGETLPRIFEALHQALGS